MTIQTSNKDFHDQTLPMSLQCKSITSDLPESYAENNFNIHFIDNCVTSSLSPPIISDFPVPLYTTETKAFYSYSVNSVDGCAPITYSLNLPSAPSLPLFEINENGQIEVTPTSPDQIGDYVITSTACVQPRLPSEPICVESEPFVVSVWDLCNAN